MNQEVKNLKKGDLVLMDKQAFVVLGNEHDTKSGTHSCKLLLENFMSNHRTEKHFSAKHHLRTLESISTTFDLVGLLDETNGKQFLSLLTKDTVEPIEDKFTEHDDIINYLVKYFEKNDAPLSVTYTVALAAKQHRTETDLPFERITHLEGFDMKYQHDHHHKHHHVHNTSN